MAADFNLTNHLPMEELHGDMEGTTMVITQFQAIALWVKGVSSTVANWLNISTVVHTYIEANQVAD